MAKQQGGGLPKKIVDIGLTAGVNKKRDSHQLQNGELLTAENVIFTNVDGQICKRNGFAPVTPAGAAFQGGPFKAIGVRDGVEPLILGQNTLNRYNTNQNLSTALTTPTQGRLETLQVQGSSGKSALAWPPTHASMATDGTQYTCVVWAEPNLTGSWMWYGIQDLATGAWIISPTLFYNPVITSFTNTGSTYTVNSQMEPLVRYNNGQFWLFFIVTGQRTVSGTTTYAANICCGTIALNNLAAGITYNSFQAPIVYSSQYLPSSPTNLVFDIHFSGGKYLLATGNSPDGQGGTISCGTVSGTTMTQTYTYSVTNASGMAAMQYYRISCKADGPASTPFAVVTNDKAFILSPDLTVVNTYSNSASTTVFASPVDCMWVSVSGVSRLVWVTGIQTTAYWRPTIIQLSTTATVILNFSVPTPVQTWYGDILSRLFQNSIVSKVYFWAGIGGPTSDSIYNSAFLFEVDLTGASRVVCRTLYTTNYHIAYNHVLHPVDVLQVPSTQRFFTMLTSGQEKASNTASWRAYGTLNRVLFDFAPARQPQIVSLPTGGNLIAGGYPLYYDGNDVVEAGFSSAPTADTMSGIANWTNASYGVPTVTSAGSGIAGGTQVSNASGYIEYYYVICFVRRDAYGNVYRSAPSPVITVPCPNAFNSVAFTAYQSNGGGNIQIEFYRSTQNTPGSFYKINTVPNGASFTDSTPDGTGTSSINKNAQVYTISGELPNDPPPPIHHIALSEQRAFCIPADNRNVVWYSKQFSPGRTVEWCANLTMSEGLNSGQFEGLAVMDSFLIVFKKNSILFTTGNGPDNTGANGSFAPFQKIATDVGCIEAASIQVIPDGVVFKSYRGIELLTRGLSLTYIGNNVENLVALNGPLSSIVLMPNFNELRFIPALSSRTITNPDGTTYTYAPCVLTYDYQGKRWSTQTNMASTQALNINNDYWWISADGTLVNKETPNKYLDNTTPITMTLETPEIPVGSAGGQGWGRAYRMALLGDFFSPHSLKLQFAYDHSPTYTDTVTFNTTSGLISGESVEQFRLSRLPRSTMQTLRIKIQDTSQSGTMQSCAISDLVLEVGDKSGLARLPGIKTL